MSQSGKLYSDIEKALAREVCQELHQFCLKEGLECDPAEQRAYTRMIVHLNNKWGPLLRDPRYTT